MRKDRATPSPCIVVSSSIRTVRCGVLSICAWVFQNLVSGRRTTPHFLLHFHLLTLTRRRRSFATTQHSNCHGWNPPNVNRQSIAADALVWIQPESDTALLLVYTSAVVLTIALLLGMFYLMKRFTPRLLKVVAGKAW